MLLQDASANGVYHLGQRVRVRGRLWDVEDAKEAESGQLLTLRDPQDPSRMLRLLSAVEEIETLPAPALPQALAPYREWRILHDAILVTMKPPPGILAGFDQANISVEKYQLEPARRAFKRPRQRLIIADDVGLGKTIEASLIMLELRARRRAERTLVVCPAGLQDQWQDELEEKAGLSFDVFDSDRVREVRQQSRLGENPWLVKRRIITSIDYVKRPEIRRMLRDVRWDLVIVDEAHYLCETSSLGRAYRTDRSRFGTFIANQADSLILLTATPHTGDPRSFYSLVCLVDDALVPTPDAMTRQLTAPVVVRRYKRDIKNPDGTDRFKDLKQHTVPVLFASDAERKLYEAVHRYTQKRYKRAGADTAVGFAMTVIKKRLISSRAALIETLKQRSATLTAEPVEVNVKRGVVADYRAGAPLSEAQQEEAERRVVGAAPLDEGDRRDERKQIERLLKLAESIKEPDAKAKALLEAIEQLRSGKQTGTAEKVIVFTEFRDTHAFLHTYFKEHGLGDAIVTLTGGMSRAERTSAIDAFNHPNTDVLLATDAASEGLNLQEHCRIVIHYELPWNPNRLEQRNGRVHRWGQDRDVYAWSFMLVDTYDSKILDLLIKKTEQIRKDLGSAADVIGVLSAVPWEDFIMRSKGVKEGEKDDAETDHAKDDIEERARQAKQAVENQESQQFGPRPVFDANESAAVDDEIRRSAPWRLSAERRRDAVEFVVGKLGGAMTSKDRKVYAISVPPALRHGNVGTTIDRAAFAHEDIPIDARGIDVIGAQHPLLQAVGVVARASLYDAKSPLAGLRLSGKAAQGPRPGVLFTFTARYVLGDGEPYAEEFVPVFVGEDGNTSVDHAADYRSFEAQEEAAQVDQARVASIAAKLSEYLAPARLEAMRRTTEKASLFETQENERVAVMLEDLQRWSDGRQAWLERQIALPAEQMELLLDETSANTREGQEAVVRQQRRLRTELDLLPTNVKRRREDLTRRSSVRPPDDIQLVGALVIISA